MAIVVRDPSLDDFKQINDLGRWFQENSNFRNCGWSDGKAYGFVKSGSDPSSDTFMLVAKEGGELVGFFLGNVVEYFFSDEKIAQELVLVFKPEHRKNISPILIDMLDKFEVWAKDKNAVEVSAGIFSGIAGKGYHKFLESRGYKQSGVAFKKEV